MKAIDGVLYYVGALKSLRSVFSLFVASGRENTESLTTSLMAKKEEKCWHAGAETGVLPLKVIGYCQDLLIVWCEECVEILILPYFTNMGM